MPWEVLAASILAAAVVGFLLGRWLRRGGDQAGPGQDVAGANQRQLAEARSKADQLQAEVAKTSAERDQAVELARKHEDAVESLAQQLEAKSPPPIPGSPAAAAQGEITALRKQVDRLKKDALKLESETRVHKQNAEKHKQAFQESLTKSDDMQQSTERLKRKQEKAQAETMSLVQEVERLKQELAEARTETAAREQARIAPVVVPSQPPPAEAPATKEDVSIFDLALQSRESEVESKSPFDAPARPSSTEELPEPSTEASAFAGVFGPDEPEEEQEPREVPAPTGPTVLDVIDQDPSLGRGARETLRLVYERFAPRAATYGSAEEGLTVIDVLDGDPNLNRGQRETIRTMYGTYVRDPK